MRKVQRGGILMKVWDLGGQVHGLLPRVDDCLSRHG